MNLRCKSEIDVCATASELLNEVIVAAGPEARGETMLCLNTESIAVALEIPVIVVGHSVAGEDASVASKLVDVDLFVVLGSLGMAPL